MSWPTRVGLFLLSVVCGIVLAAALLDYAAAEANDQHERHPIEAVEPTVEEVIRWHASSRGVSGDALVRLAVCESRLDPNAVGDHGTSYGLFQLSALPTGLLRHFYHLGYTDAFDAEQAAEYVSRVGSGEFLRDGTPLHPWGRVTLSRWSCWR